MKHRQAPGPRQTVTGSHEAVPGPGWFSRLKTQLNISKRGLYVAGTIAAVAVVVLIAIVLRTASENRSYSVYFSRAAESYAAGDYDSALTDLRKAASVEQTRECLMLMADCYEAQGNLDKALEVLRLLDTREPEVAQRIMALERRRDSLNSADKVTIAGTEYPLNTASLSLMDMGLTDGDMEQIVKLYALTSLNLSGNSLTDISALSTLGGLSALDLSDNNISDISALAGLKGLRALYLDRNPVGDFSALYALENLTTLSIKGVEISEEQLKALSTALPSCAIHSDNDPDSAADITLGGVTFKSDVTELNLSNLGITDISALSVCRNLERLDLTGNQISDLTPLMDIPGLKKLYIKDNLITDLRPLMALTTLQCINAEGNGISSTVPLGSLTGLTELYLAGNPLSDCSALAKLTNLETLGLEDTGLKDEDLACLKGLTSLRLLSIYNNPALGGEAVDQLQSSIGACRIDHDKLVYSIQIGEEKYREDVTELDLSNRGLTDISALSFFKNLERVNLRGNNLENIYIFQWTSGIKELDLACNNISDATAIAYMSNLETLDLSGNKISSVSPFMTLTGLKELNLSGNNIEPEQIERLRASLPNCTILFD